MFQKMRFHFHLRLDYIIYSLIINSIFKIITGCRHLHISFYRQVNKEFVADNPLFLKMSVERVKLHVFDLDQSHNVYLLNIPPDDWQKSVLNVWSIFP